MVARGPVGAGVFAALRAQEQSDLKKTKKKSHRELQGPPVKVLEPVNAEQERQKFLRRFQEYQQEKAEGKHEQNSNSDSSSSNSSTTSDPNSLSGLKHTVGKSFTYSRKTAAGKSKQPSCAVFTGAPVWTEHRNPNNGRVYYFNKATKQSTYTQPTSMFAPTAPKPVSIAPEKIQPESYTYRSNIPRRQGASLKVQSCNTGTSPKIIQHI